MIAACSALPRSNKRASAFEHRPKPTGRHLVLSRLGATGLKGGYIELEVAATEELFFEYLCDRSW